MPTTLKTAVANDCLSRNPARSTRAEYQTTLRKWKDWGGGVSIERLGRKEIRDFLDWVYERAVAEEGGNPGRTANKVREHLRAVISWAWEQDLIESPPRFPKPKEQRDVAGRHYLTKTEINALYFATHKMKTATRAGAIRFLSVGIGDAPLSCSSTTALTQGPFGRHSRNTSRSSGGTYLGIAIARPGNQGTVALGMDILPQGEDRQDLLPADEPRRPCPHQEPHAGKPQP